MFESEIGRLFVALRRRPIISAASIQEPTKWPSAQSSAADCGFARSSFSSPSAQPLKPQPHLPRPQQIPGTSTDFFIMPGSDFDRPGLVPRANLNIGIGHTFKFLNKDPIGDELTFHYTYENAGSHGFFHTNFGSHTEALGIKFCS
jgi:hypothetical protein